MCFNMQNSFYNKELFSLGLERWFMDKISFFNKIDVQNLMFKMGVYIVEGENKFL